MAKLNEINQTNLFCSRKEMKNVISQTNVDFCHHSRMKSRSCYYDSFSKIKHQIVMRCIYSEQRHITTCVCFINIKLKHYFNTNKQRMGLNRLPVQSGLWMHVSAQFDLQLNIYSRQILFRSKLTLLHLKLESLSHDCFSEFYFS